MVQLDRDEEMRPVHRMCGTLDAELEVQRIVKSTELTGFLCFLRKANGPTTVHVGNKGIIDGSWRGEMRCIGPKANDAGFWGAADCWTGDGVKRRRGRFFFVAGEVQRRSHHRRSQGVVLPLLLGDECLVTVEVTQVPDCDYASVTRRTHASGVNEGRTQLVSIIVLRRWRGPRAGVYGSVDKRRQGHVNCGKKSSSCWRVKGGSRPCGSKKQVKGLRLKRT